VGYQWLRCDAKGGSCSEIVGATGQEYTAGPLDVGHQLRATVKEATAGSSPVETVASAVVEAAVPAVALLPRVMGARSVGARLTAVGELWFGTPPFSLSFQWLRCDASGSLCSPIVGETASTHISSVADAAGSVVVEVRAQNAVGSAVARSKAFSFSAQASTLATCFQTPTMVSLPTTSPSGSIVSGGQISKASDGTWSPAFGTCANSQFRYAWFRDGGLVVDNGTSSAPYTTGAADQGHVIEMQVTYEYTTDVYHGWSARASGVTVNAPQNYPPVTPYENVFPPDFGLIDGDGSKPFYMKFSDPDGESGFITYTIRNSSNVVVQTAVGQTVGSGADSIAYTSTPLASGDYSWTAVATDVRGATSGTSGVVDFSVNQHPGAPTLGTPASATVVPSVNPVLAINTSTNPDPEQDQLAYFFKIAKNSDCSTNVVATSGWLPGTSTWTVPSGALLDGQDYWWCAKAADYWQRVSSSTSEGPFSAAWQVKIRLPKLGLRDYWPLWSRGPLAVNQATGNLVLSLPGPSIPTAAGTLAASLTYNALDARPAPAGLPAGWTLAVGEDPPRLIDHSQAGVSDRFDAVERISADGSSDYYTRVGTSTTYQSSPGDTSTLAKTATGGFLLTDADGSVFEFGLPSATTGVADLLRAETSSASAGLARMEYIYAAGKISTITAWGKNNASVDQQLGKLTFNWACAGALVCIEGPDNAGTSSNVTWKYVGDGNGRLFQAHNGTRTIAEIAYGTNGKPSSVKNANDLNPGAASPGYLTGHAVQVGYDANNRVTTVTDAVRNRYYTPTSPTATWTFAYTVGGPCAGVALQPARATHTAAQPTLGGCTDLIPPRLQGTGKKLRVFWDNLAHPLETLDAAGNWSLSAYNTKDQLDWVEDEDGNPTDYVYDAFDFSLQSVTGPDGAGALVRPVTSYRYDEQAVGSTPTTAGTALTGVRAAYFDNYNLTGRPKALQTDASVNFDWGTAAPAPLPGVTDNLSVRWSGVLTIATAGDYYFATRADGNTRLTVDGTIALDAWSSQPVPPADACSPTKVTLTAGRHRLVLDYRDSTGAASVQLRLSAVAATNCASTTVIAGLTPGYLNQTSVVAPPNTTGGTARVSFTHFDKPHTGLPDYTLATAGSQNVITSFEYDGFGRITKKWMPKANSSRTIATDGTLNGTATGPYSTTWAYYEAGVSATPPATCGGTARTQRGLLQSLTPSGITATSSVVDLFGRPVAVTNGAGTLCRVYDAEGRLTSDKAAGEAASTTYTYDPAGAPRTATNASGTVTSIYNEAGALLDQTDTFGAEMELVYDLEANATTRRLATGPLSTSTVYSTSYAYNDDNQLTSLTDPASRVYSFFYDPRGNLKATKYPNATFSWRDTNPAGWTSAVYNRHGTFTTLPASVPADASPIVDFSYSSFQNGQRASEVRTGGGLTTDTNAYTYDALGRLDSAQQPAGSKRYCYDLDSNRTTLFTAASGVPPVCTAGSPDTTYTYNPAVTGGVDQLTSLTEGGATPQTRSFAYDTDGNTTARGTDSLTWDGRGRLSGGVQRGTQITYSFDAAGFRRQRVGVLRYGGEVIQHAPYLYWRLGDPSGTTAADASGSSLPGTYAGGVTLAQTGPLTTETNTAASFDGVNDTISRPVATTATTNVTLEAWVYWRGGSGQQIILYNGTPGTNGYGLAIGNGSCAAGTTLYLILGGVSCSAASGGTLALNTWTHVAAVRASSGTWTVYVNGVAQGTSTLAPLTPTGSTTVSPTTNPLNAKVDEVALYTRGLAAANLLAHYQRATATVSKTTRFLLGGQIETDETGVITLYETDGPEGDLARYAGPPITATTVNFLYWNAHGDLAAQANTAGVRQAAYTYDPFGAATQQSLPGNAATERYTGRWDKKLDSSSQIIEMGARPYDPDLGRFLSIDPIEGGSHNNYDYANADPVNEYDLDGQCPVCVIVAIRLAPIVIPIAVRAVRAGPVVSRSAKIHGNSAASPRTAYLYRLTTKSGEYLKTGISQNPGKRYSRTFMKDKDMQILTSGPRRALLKLERTVIQIDRGPLNRERFRGTRN